MSSRRSIRRVGGVWVSEDTAFTVAAYYRGVMYISATLAKLPFHIKDFDGNTLWKDPIRSLLNVEPNPEMGAFDFKCLAIQRAITSGNFYAEISYSLDGRPVRMDPLLSREVTLVRDSSGNLLYQVNRPQVGQYFLEPRQIYHLKNMHLSDDGLQGLGLVAYGSRSIGISKGADQMASGLFNNAGLPSGFIEHPKTLSDEAWARLEKSFQEDAGGENAGGLKLLEEGAKFVALEIDAQVLQFLESRKFSVVEIARFLGLPPHKLFDTAAATFSNVENSNLEVVNDTIDGWARKMENEVDRKLLKNQYAGKYSEMDIREANRGDMTSRAEYFSKMMQNGSLSPNEIREAEGRSNIGPVGDKRYIAVNNLTPEDRVDDVLDAEISLKEAKALQALRSGSEKPDEEEGTPAPGEDSGSELEAALVEYLKSPKK